MDNNVYIVRCRSTGESLLIDAANEHDKLLELCRALDVRQVVETHGHWDHIQAVEAVRDAGIDVAVTAADAGMLPSYDQILEDESVLEVGRLRIRTIATPGHTPGLDVLRRRGHAAPVHRGHAVPRRARATPRSSAPTSPPSSSRSRTGCSRPFGPDTIVLPGHGVGTTIGAESPHLQEWVDRGW